MPCNQLPCFPVVFRFVNVGRVVAKLIGGAHHIRPAFHKWVHVYAVHHIVLEAMGASRFPGFPRPLSGTTQAIVRACPDFIFSVGRFGDHKILA